MGVNMAWNGWLDQAHHIHQMHVTFLYLQYANLILP